MHTDLRVALVEPVTPRLLDARTVASLRSLVRGVELLHTGLDDGPHSVETLAEEAAATPGTVAAVQRAAAAGASAAVVACVADVAVAEARLVAGIPVVGPGEAALGLTAASGGRATIVIATGAGVPGMRRAVRRSGHAGALASIRTLGVPVVEMAAAPERVGKALCGEADAAVADDGADTIVIGCTVATPARRRLEEHLADSGARVRVVDPLSLAVQVAAAYAAHLRAVPHDPGEPRRAPAGPEEDRT